MNFLFASAANKDSNSHVRARNEENCLAMLEACKKYGIKPESLGYESFVKLIESDPQFSLSTNAKGVTYINKRR